MSSRQLGRRVFVIANETDVGPVAVGDPRRSSVAVLDLMLPGPDGMEVYRRLRELGPVAVIMLTAPGVESDGVLGIEPDADDDPLSSRALEQRVQSVLSGARRSLDPATAGSRTLRAGDIELDVLGHRAEKGGRPLHLTGREFDLLAFFLANPGRAFTRAQLLEKVWGWSFGDQSTVTVHIRRLREKIEADPANPRLLATVWGFGYRLDPPPADELAALPRQRGVGPSPVEARRSGDEDGPADLSGEPASRLTGSPTNH